MQLTDQLDIKIHSVKIFWELSAKKGVRVAMPTASAFGDNVIGLIVQLSLNMLRPYKSGQNSVDCYAIAYQIPFGENKCLQVNSSVTKGLIIHAEANPNSPQVGQVNSGETVRVSEVPIYVINNDNNNWIEIESPVKGWIANGPPGRRGNLSMCKL